MIPKIINVRLFIVVLLLLLFSSLFSQENRTSSGDDYINIRAVEDTTNLKLVPYDGKVSMRQLSTVNANGGGIFITVDSAYIENGTVAYSHPTQGQQWVRDVFLQTNSLNVKWAGAKGDNSNDDRSAILRACQVGNCNVIFPDGIYWVDIDTATESIQLIDNTTLMGSGSVVLKYDCNEAPLFYALNDSCIVVKDLNFVFSGTYDESDFIGDVDVYGFGETIGGHQYNAYFMVLGCSKCTFENLTFKGDTPSSNKIQNAIIMLGKASNTLVSNNTFRNLYINDAIMGIGITQQNNLLIDGIKSYRYHEGWSGGPGHLIYHWVPDDDYCTTQSTNCIISNITDYGEPSIQNHYMRGSTIAVKGLLYSTISTITSHRPNAVLDYSDCSYTTVENVMWESDYDVGTWAQSTSYSLNELARNDSVYLCIGAGTSAGSGTGPSGEGTSISDGSVTWRYVELSPPINIPQRTMSVTRQYNYFNNIKLVHGIRYEATISMGISSSCSENDNFHFNGVYISCEPSSTMSNAIFKVRSQNFTIMNLVTENRGSQTKDIIQFLDDSRYGYVEWRGQGTSADPRYSFLNTSKDIKVRILQSERYERAYSDNNKGSSGDNSNCWEFFDNPSGLFYTTDATTDSPNVAVYIPRNGAYLFNVIFQSQDKEDARGGLYILAFDNGDINDYTYSELICTEYDKGSVFDGRTISVDVNNVGMVSLHLDGTVASDTYYISYGWLKIGNIE